MEPMNFFLLFVGFLIGFVFGVLLMRLKNPTKNDDVFSLTPEQREERDESSISHGVSGQYPVTLTDAFPSLSEHAKAMYPPASADSFPQLEDPEYEKKADEHLKLRTEQAQKEMEEKRMAQVEKDKLRDAEIEEERVLKEEAARIKTELKKWMY
jgi:hypothetical protein